jgi:hypothetical protein
LYRYLLRSHLDPAFSTWALADIKEPHVRRWRKNLLDAQVSAVTVAKAYRLLKAIFNTAVDDGLIRGTRAGSEAPDRRSHPSGRS